MARSRAGSLRRSTCRHPGSGQTAPGREPGDSDAAPADGRRPGRRRGAPTGMRRGSAAATGWGPDAGRDWLGGVTGDRRRQAPSGLGCPPLTAHRRHPGRTRSREPSRGCRRLADASVPPRAHQPVPGPGPRRQTRCAGHEKRRRRRRSTRPGDPERDEAGRQRPGERQAGVAEARRGAAASRCAGGGRRRHRSIGSRGSDAARGARRWRR